MSNIDRAFGKIQQMIRERKSELIKWYNTNFDKEKKRLHKENLTLKEDVGKIETIEKTWEKALLIIKNRSTIYLLKRVDYIGNKYRINFYYRGVHRII